MAVKGKKTPKNTPSETKEKVAPVAKAAKKPSGDSEILVQLNRILEAELSGVVRYLHYSFMIFGPNRIPITKWFREHALEGFAHAVTIGEKITALGGHPTLSVNPVPESNKHSVSEILKESLEFEYEGLELYNELLPLTQGNVALEEMVRGLVADETNHIEEVEKMIRSAGK